MFIQNHVNPKAEKNCLPSQKTGHTQNSHNYKKLKKTNWEIGRTNKQQCDMTLKVTVVKKEYRKEKVTSLMFPSNKND